MKDPDEQPDGFEAEVLEEALRKLPPEDVDRVRQEAINEMQAEARMGAGPPMYLPPEVRQRIYAYAKEHSLHRDKLIMLAINSTKGRTEEVVENMDRYLKDPDSFEWPLEDPLLCVLIAYMRMCASWMIKKINLEYGDDDEDDDQADWWRGEEAE
jgi:hypothetical protein